MRSKRTETKFAHFIGTQVGSHCYLTSPLPQSPHARRMASPAHLVLFGPHREDLRCFPIPLSVGSTTANNHQATSNSATLCRQRPVGQRTSPTTPKSEVRKLARLPWRMHGQSHAFWRASQPPTPKSGRLQLTRLPTVCVLTSTRWVTAGQCVARLAGKGVPLPQASCQRDSSHGLRPADQLRPQK